MTAKRPRIVIKIITDDEDYVGLLDLLLISILLVRTTGE
jgi:hypothetical protein